MKRALDLLFSAVGLSLLWPTLAFIGTVVFLTSGKPVFFRQVRVGRGGRPFMLVKYRTMAHRLDAKKGLFEPGNQARVTAFGRILRATKLDEFPQLWNVLKGEMSFVGPRPEVPRWVEVYPRRWQKVLTVRPGITDPASVFFRHEETILAKSSDPEEDYRRIILPKKLDLYDQYIDKNALLEDLRLIIRTIGELFRKDQG